MPRLILKLWDFVDINFANTNRPEFCRLFHLLLFYNICLLTCFNIKTFGHVCYMKMILLVFLRNTDSFGSLNLVDGFVFSKNTNLFVREKLNSFLTRTFLYSFREEIFAWKEIGKFNKWTFANVFFESLQNKLLLLLEKYYNCAKKRKLFDWHFCLLAF